MNRFDSLYRRMLKEEESPGCSNLTFVESRTAFARGDIYYPRELFGMREFIEGTPVVVIIDTIEKALEKARQAKIPHTPNSLDECGYFQIFVDNADEPRFVHFTCSWHDEADPDVDIFALFYRAVCSDLLSSKETKPTSSEITNIISKIRVKEITFEKLKEIKYKRLTQTSFKGHELKDLVDF